MKTRNIVANTFLFFGILFMFALLVLPAPYWVIPAVWSAMCYIFAVRLYKPAKETKVVDLKEEEVLRLLEQFEEQDRQEYANKQIG